MENIDVCWAFVVLILGGLTLVTVDSVVSNICRVVNNRRKTSKPEKPEENTV